MTTNTCVLALDPESERRVAQTRWCWLTGYKPDAAGAHRVRFHDIAAIEVR